MYKKILWTTPRLNRPGGVSNYVSLVYSYLRDHVDLFFIGSLQESEGLFKFKRIFSDYIALCKLLLKSDYQLIHINTSLAWKAFLRDMGIIVISILFKRPFIIYFHGWNQDFEKIVQSAPFSLFRLLLFRSQAIIVLAQSFKETLLAWGYRQPIYVETTAVPDENFAKGEQAMRRRSQRAGEFTLLFLSRLERAKGIYESIQAYTILKRRAPQSRFIIAGDGSEKAAAMHYAVQLGVPDIEFVGFVSGHAKDAVLSDADALLFPSYGEGMPTNVLEAMSFGLPVITRPVGGLKDFFQDGQMGFLTESLNPEVFAEYLYSLLHNNNITDIGFYNINYANNHFRASSIANRLLNIYANVTDFKY
jgi:glycosyltransferase involved in cell wall biosynthesis